LLQLKNQRKQKMSKTIKFNQDAPINGVGYEKGDVVTIANAEAEEAVSKKVAEYVDKKIKQPKNRAVKKDEIVER